MLGSGSLGVASSLGLGLEAIRKFSCASGVFPKLGYLFGGPITRIVIYWGLYGGPYLGKLAYDPSNAPSSRGAELHQGLRLVFLALSME